MSLPRFELELLHKNDFRENKLFEENNTLSGYLAITQYFSQIQVNPRTVGGLSQTRSAGEVENRPPVRSQNDAT